MTPTHFDDRGRAEYRLGGMLKEAKAAGDMRTGGNARKEKLRSPPSTATPPTLAELGVSKNLSKIASLPKEPLP
jgi:hypothetical protein